MGKGRPLTLPAPLSSRALQEAEILTKISKKEVLNL